MTQVQGGYLISDEQRERILDIGVHSGWIVNVWVDNQLLGMDSFLAHEEAAMDARCAHYQIVYGSRVRLKVEHCLPKAPAKELP